MAEIWPAELPQCFLPGSVQWLLGDARLRTPMEAGPVKTRRRTSAVSDLLQGDMKFTLAQWQRFKTFVRVDIQDADTFEFPDVDGASGSLLVKLAEGMPSGNKFRGGYLATLQLEVLP